MKTTTRSNDLSRAIAVRVSAKILIEKRQSIDHALDHGTEEVLAIKSTPYYTARAAHHAALAAFKSLPKIRREAAEALRVSAMDYAKSVARRIGGLYSGTNRHCAEWGTTPRATTITGSGDQYSRSCTYRKTDAVHAVTLSVDGVPHLMQSEHIRNASVAEGLPLISLTPAGECTWVRAKGKAITSERGWIAYSPDFGGTCYHSTKSMKLAERGLANKLTGIRADRAEAAESRKMRRRLELIARLCHGAIATRADAQSLGYCQPGISAFQQRHGIGDTASLPELMRTGDPQAQRLALLLARKIHRNQSIAA